MRGGRRIPEQPFTLAGAPEGVSAEPICLPEGEGLVSLIYLADGTSLEQELDALLTSGSVLVMTAFDEGKGRAPLPCRQGEPASDPEAG